MGPMMLPEDVMGVELGMIPHFPFMWQPLARTLIDYFIALDLMDKHDQ